MQSKTERLPGSALNSARERADTAEAESEISEPHAKEGQSQQADTSGGETAKTGPTNIFHGFTGTGSRVVQQAASILEEEIAAGIVAAKRVEKHFVDSSALRLNEPNALMQRFRRDLHEVVDIVVDLINVAVQYVDGLGQRTVTIRGVKHEADLEHKTDNGRLSTLAMSRPVKAGESVELTMVLENGNEEPTDESSFHSTDLVNANSDRILAEQVVFRPSSVVVGPNTTEEITVSVNVAEETPAGIYSGLIQATGLDQLRAVLMVQVD
jgi:hypothetical protein